MKYSYMINTGPAQYQHSANAKANTYQYKDMTLLKKRSKMISFCHS